MKKIAVITLYHNNNNYGGIAQAYALQKFLQNSGYNCEMLSYRRSDFGYFNIPKKKLSTFEFAGKAAQRVIERIFCKFIRGKKEMRNSAFGNSREIIPHSQIYTEETISAANDSYDIFISGSDQIWKPRVMQLPYVLSFVNNDKIKLSYASSIAQSGLSDEYGSFMKEHLSSYKMLSVREQEASAYLSGLLSREVYWTADPTLLLDRSEWESIIPSERKITAPYVFAYFLGDSRKQRKYAERFARENNLRLVVMPHLVRGFQMEDILWGDVRDYDSDLGDFLNLVRGAETVITDSFHAVVFSYIFGRSFAVFNREQKWSSEDMSSRIKSLLYSMGQQGRLYDSFPKHLETGAVDYSANDSKLRAKIAESRKLLLDTLSDSES